MATATEVGGRQATAALVAPPAPSKGEVRCRSCGHSHVVHRTPGPCPFCGSSKWESVPWRPFSRPGSELTRL